MLCSDIRRTVNYKIWDLDCLIPGLPLLEKLSRASSSLKYYRHMEAILIPYRNTLKNKEKGNVGTDRKQGSQK